MTSGKVFLIRLRWELQPAAWWPAIPGYHDIIVRQEEKWPFGRKGAILAGTWSSLERTGVDGVVINDLDVVIDPHDHRVMMIAIRTDPMAIWTAPVKLWPNSTGDKSWSWSHGEKQGVRSQIDTDRPTWFGFGFTYLPAKLLDASIAAGLGQWKYPWVDTKVGEMARTLEMEVKVLRNGCNPKHINF